VLSLDFVWVLGLALLFLVAQVAQVAQRLFPLHAQEKSTEADK
jgi:hypothetical protein